MTVADRIAIMDKGNCVQIAPPSQIYEQPATRYVAEFIGDVNIFTGSVVASAPGGVRIVSADPELAIDSNQSVTAEIGTEVAFAVRPEKVSISLEPPADPSVNALQGEVWDIGYLGDLSVYHVRLSNGRNVRAAIINARRTVERPITWEDTVWLTWGREAGVVLAR